MDTSLKRGFLIHYFRDLKIFRTVTMDQSVPFSVQERCPSCETLLKTFCTLIAGGDARRMRLGRCSLCGYAGYIDRPTKEWIVSFYADEWDDAKIKNVKEEAERLRHKPTASQRDVVHLANDLPIDRTRPVCDVGSGTGVSLKEFENIGFSNLIGVENSRYRSELVREKYVYTVFTGNFENEKVQQSLQEFYPIGIFFSRHVLEHVYNPAEAIAAMSHLQKDGDYLILAMPELREEPAATLLFWLPHLHSFTKYTLEHLLNAHGYEIVADNFTYYDDMMVVGRKSKNPKVCYVPKTHAISEMEEKINDFFLLDSLNREGRYVFSWRTVPGQDEYATALDPIFSIRAFDRVQQCIEKGKERLNARLFKLFTTKHSFAVSALTRRYTKPEESLFEIQYEGPIQLLIR